MRKYLSLFILLATTSFSYSQLGVSLGYNIGVTEPEDSSTTFKSNIKSLGFLWDLKIFEKLDIQPQVSIGFVESSDPYFNMFGDRYQSQNRLGIGLDFQYYLFNRSTGFYISPGIYHVTLSRAEQEIGGNYYTPTKNSLLGAISIGYEISNSISLAALYSMEYLNNQFDRSGEVKRNAYGIVVQIIPRISLSSSTPTSKLKKVSKEMATNE